MDSHRLHFKTPLVFSDNLLNSQKHTEILSQHLGPLLHPEAIFQLDNASCHVSTFPKVLKLGFFENSIQLLEWPPVSPHLNIIEN